MATHQTVLKSCHQYTVVLTNSSHTLLPRRSSCSWRHQSYTKVQDNRKLYQRGSTRIIYVLCMLFSGRIVITRQYPAWFVSVQECGESEVTPSLLLVFIDSSVIPWWWPPSCPLHLPLNWYMKITAKGHFDLFFSASKLVNDSNCQDHKTKLVTRPMFAEMITHSIAM